MASPGSDFRVAEQKQDKHLLLGRVLKLVLVTVREALKRGLGAQ